MVDASRRHLTERYASGVDLLLWETEKRLVPDLDAIKAVTGAAVSRRNGTAGSRRGGTSVRRRLNPAGVGE